MPDGTIQDSRNPNSPQWGYLALEEDDKPQFLNHADDVDYGNARGLLDNGGPNGASTWNRYILFLNTKATSGKKRFKKGDRVHFIMTELDIQINNDPGTIWVANIQNQI